VIFFVLFCFVFDVLLFFDVLFVFFVFSCCFFPFFCFVVFISLFLSWIFGRHVLFDRVVV
jgi:hypothetical protein